jgi:mannose-6-phosphate isomerase-like protein (cupin superfamily)
MTSPTIITRDKARFFLEGPEECREYVREPKMWFGTSTLPPGATGDTDRGHPQSVEVFFCASGTVIVDDGSTQHAMSTGDALRIPEGVSHTITNTGTSEAVVVWAGAPGE